MHAFYVMLLINVYILISYNASPPYRIVSIDSFTEGFEDEAYPRGCKNVSETILPRIVNYTPTKRECGIKFFELPLAILHRNKRIIT